MKVTKDVVDLLLGWKNNGRDVDVDIELLLETIEKLENRKSDIMPLFYTNKNSVLEKFEKLEADSDTRLSVILKQFVKAETGKTDLALDCHKEIFNQAANGVSVRSLLSI